MDLYTQLKDLGCEIDSHESDLYVRCTPEALAAVRKSGRYFKMFTHAVSRDTWIDVPFAYEPWWAARSK